MSDSLNAIIAQGGNPTTPAPDVANLFATAYKLKQMKAEQQSQNALKAFFSDQSNIGPDQLPTDNALAKLYKEAPTAAMGLIEQDAKIRNERALGSERAQKAALELDNYAQKGVREPALNAYDQALKDGMTPDAAKAAGQRAYTEGLDELRKSGAFSADQMEQFDRNFDPDRVRARAKISSIRSAAETSGAWETVVDPKTGMAYDHNKVSGANRTMDGKPYDPQGAQRLGGPTPESQKPGLSEAGVAYYAEQFRTLGPSALGRLSKPDRERVVNYAAVDAGAGGAEEDIKTQRAGQGAQAEQRSMGTRTGQLEIAEREMEGAVELSSKAYEKLPRTQFVPFNQLANLVEKKTSSPEQAAAYAADNAIVNIYARMISPTGQGTDSDKNHAREMLNQAQGPEAHQAVLNQLMAEGRNAATKAKEARAAATDETPLAQHHGGHPIPADLKAQYDRVVASKGNAEGAKKALQAAGYDVSSL